MLKAFNTFARNSDMLDPSETQFQTNGSILLEMTAVGILQVICLVFSDRQSILNVCGMLLEVVPGYSNMINSILN